MIGVDYAGPIKYRTRGRNEGKACIVLFACSLTRGLYLELLPDLTTDEFLGSLRRLIARRGKPNKIYSDVEITLNNRPLGYIEDDVELPVLTPNSLLSGQPNILPEMDPSGIEDADLRKRARYLLRRKEALWRR